MHKGDTELIIDRITIAEPKVQSLAVRWVQLAAH